MIGCLFHSDLRINSGGESSARRLLPVYGDTLGYFFGIYNQQQYSCATYLSSFENNGVTGFNLKGSRMTRRTSHETRRFFKFREDDFIDYNHDVIFQRTRFFMAGGWNHWNSQLVSGGDRSDTLWELWEAREARLSRWIWWAGGPFFWRVKK